MPITAQFLVSTPTAAPGALVDQGVSSLSGWGAAFLVLVVLGVIAWWATRSSRRRPRR